MARLILQIDPIIRFRNATQAVEADPVRAAIFAEIGGIDGVACTLSEEEGGLSDREIRFVREVIRTELHLFVPMGDSAILKATGFSPAQVILLPSGKAPAEGGVDPVGQASILARQIHELKPQVARLGLAIDFSLNAVKAAAKLEADVVFFDLGRLGELKRVDQAEYLEGLFDLSLAAEKLGLGVAIGHGLTYYHLSQILSRIRVHTVYVGNALLGRALWIGMEAAVRDMAALVHG